MSSRFDGKDTEILSILLKAATTPKAEIARRVGLAASAVSERIRRLEDTGIVKSYESRLDGDALRIPLLAFVFVTELKPTSGFDTGAELSRVTGVEEVHKIAGDDCFLLKIRAEGTAELGVVLDTEINPIPTVARVRTTIVLRSILEGPPLSGIPVLSGGVDKRDLSEIDSQQR
jgi:Lrp/AsnC family transcriptional regulator, leucine-responsive regulatory protein